MVGSNKKPKIEVVDEEKFDFSFVDEAMNARECLEFLERIQSKEQFYNTVPDNERNRFLTRSLSALQDSTFKCFDCPKTYQSGNGLFQHLKKCGDTPATADNSMAASPSPAPSSTPIERKRPKVVKTENMTLDGLRQTPTMWLELPKSEQKVVVEQVMDKDLVCFKGCGTRCKNAREMVSHLNGCIQTMYASYKDRVSEFRKLEKRLKSSYVREAMKLNGGTLKCMVCDRSFGHQYGLIYHVDRCQVEKNEQPWKCYKCGYEALANESEEHLAKCDAVVTTRDMAERKCKEMLGLEVGIGTKLSIRKKSNGSQAPRATTKKDGTVLYRYRKSVVTKDLKGIVSREDKQKYEALCESTYNEWKDTIMNTMYCEKLRSVQKMEWTRTVLDRSDPMYPIFTRQSITIRDQPSEGLQSTVPAGYRFDCLQPSRTIGQDTEQKMGVAYCGAPINGVKVAPNRLVTGEDVLCISTFGNETDLESDSSIIQFWTHRYDEEKQESIMNNWFLLHLVGRGVVLSINWLQMPRYNDDVVGFVAFSTSIGQILIYRIDSTSVPFQDASTSDVMVVVAEPHLILEQPKVTVPVDQTMSTNDTSMEVDEDENEQKPVDVKIDESIVPILKFTWCSFSGGQHLAAINALGSVILWDLDDEELDNPEFFQSTEWQSPPSDIAFVDRDTIALAFREKMMRLVNINDWVTTLEDATVKTAGTRIHCDPRICKSFFSFQTDYTAFPFYNATGVSYIAMENNEGLFIIVPLSNTHQMMTWDMAVCAPIGTIISCGIDGRVLACASGKVIDRDVRHASNYHAGKTLINLRRRRVDPEAVPTENADFNTTNAKPKLDESCITHDSVCDKMWLEFQPKKFKIENQRPLVVSLDQRVESLNCVDTNNCTNHPIAFIGGEAGILFAVGCDISLEKNTVA